MTARLLVLTALLLAAPVAAAFAENGDDVIAACEAYLASKRAEFAARLVDLVATARAAIAAVWDDMKVRSCGWVDVEAGREWGARQRGTHACRAF